MVDYLPGISRARFCFPLITFFRQFRANNKIKRKDIRLSPEMGFWLWLSPKWARVPHAGCFPSLHGLGFLFCKMRVVAYTTSTSLMLNCTQRGEESQRNCLHFFKTNPNSQLSLIPSSHGNSTQTWQASLFSHISSSPSAVLLLLFPSCRGSPVPSTGRHSPNSPPGGSLLAWTPLCSLLLSGLSCQH